MLTPRTVEPAPARAASEPRIRPTDTAWPATNPPPAPRRGNLARGVLIGLAIVAPIWAAILYALLK